MFFNHTDTQLYVAKTFVLHEVLKQLIKTSWGLHNAFMHITSQLNC